MEFILKGPKDEEPKIELWLEQEGDRGIVLKGIDGKGLNKWIMSFRKGKFTRLYHAKLDELEIDERGRIIEDKIGDN